MQPALSEQPYIARNGNAEQMRAERSKIECRNFRAGYCSYGKKCQFLHATQRNLNDEPHGKVDLAADRDPTNVGSPETDANGKKTWSSLFKETPKPKDSANTKGNTTGKKDGDTYSKNQGISEDTSYNPNNGSGEMCRYYAKHGSCRYSDTCKYVHIHPTDPNNPYTNGTIQPPPSSRRHNNHNSDGDSHRRENRGPRNRMPAQYRMPVYNNMPLLFDQYGNPAPMASMMPMPTSMSMPSYGGLAYQQPFSPTGPLVNPDFVNSSLALQTRPAQPQPYPSSNLVPPIPTTDNEGPETSDTTPTVPNADVTPSSDPLATTSTQMLTSPLMSSSIPTAVNPALFPQQPYPIYSGQRPMDPQQYSHQFSPQQQQNGGWSFQQQQQQQSGFMSPVNEMYHQQHHQFSPHYGSPGPNQGPPFAYGQQPFFAPQTNPNVITPQQHKQPLVPTATNVSGLPTPTQPNPAFNGQQAELAPKPDDPTSE